jgi:hypothetical protein
MRWNDYNVGLGQLCAEKEHFFSAQISRYDNSNAVGDPFKDHLKNISGFGAAMKKKF